MHFAVGAECQLGADVVDNFWSGRCRKGQHRSIGQQFAHLGNLEIRGAKIISPLGDAVSFVNGDKGNVHVGKFLLKEFRAKAFGRNIQKLIGVECYPTLGVLHRGKDPYRWRRPLCLSGASFAPGLSSVQ